MPQAIHNGQAYLAITTKPISQVGAFEVHAVYADEKKQDGMVFHSANYIRALENALAYARRNEGSRFTVYSVKNRSHTALAVCGGQEVIKQVEKIRREDRAPTRAQLIKELKKNGIFVEYQKYTREKLEEMVEDAESELQDWREMADMSEGIF